MKDLDFCERREDETPQELRIDGPLVLFSMTEFKDAFKIFDVDNSETITTDELLLVMKNLGMMATKEEVKEMLSEVDEDGMLLQITEIVFQQDF